MKERKGHAGKKSIGKTEKSGKNLKTKLKARRQASAGRRLENSRGNSLAEAQKELERSKTVVLWSAVVFFMVIIMFFWLNNIRHSIIISGTENRNGQAQNMAGAVNEFKEQFADIKDALEIFQDAGGISSKENTPDREPAILPENGQAEVKVMGSSSAEALKKESEILSEMKKEIEQKKSKE